MSGLVVKHFIFFTGKLPSISNSISHPKDFPIQFFCIVFTLLGHASNFSKPSNKSCENFDILNRQTYPEISDIDGIVYFPGTINLKPFERFKEDDFTDDYNINVKEHFKVVGIKKGIIKTVELSSGEKIDTKTIIIATGARWRELNVPGEKENLGNGVAYCPHCDGPFFKDKDVAVVGGGNSGIEAALDLAGIVKKVTVLEFMPDLKADKILIDKAEAKDNICLLYTSPSPRDRQKSRMPSSA